MKPQIQQVSWPIANNVIVVQNRIASRRLLAFDSEIE